MACLEVLIVFLSVGSLGFNHADAVDGEKRSMISRKEYSEFKKRLEFQKRSAVKSIKTEDGDIFDCIDINRQPAFDNPLLKNHTIQMAPSSRPKMAANRVASNKELEIGLKGGGCPQGFIPIRRARVQDLLISRSLMHSGRKRHARNFKGLAESSSVLHTYAGIASVIERYYGTQVTMNVWTPIVGLHQGSMGQLWILNGAKDKMNVIETGWIVYPRLYGNNETTRLFVLWTRDGYQKTGCHDLLCSGFVQINQNLPVGKTFLSPPSTYGGKQYELTLFVTKDFNKGNWWLEYGHEARVVGYWPNEIFTTLATKPAALEWGGQVVFNEDEQHSKPEMGSGHYASEGFEKACYMNNIMCTDESNELKPYTDYTEVVQLDEKCYTVRDDGDRGGDIRRVIYFGGPGGDCN